MHPQIEKYLEQVKGQLKSLPPAQSAEEIRELGIHLQALVEEGRERGLTESEAVKAAIAQFGSYRTLGRELCQVVLDGEPGRLPRTLSVLTFVMLSSAAMSLMRFGLEFSVETLVGWAKIVGPVAYWHFGAGLLFSALSIQAAVSLRRLRPWAFWMALLLFAYSAVRITFSIFMMFSVLSRVGVPEFLAFHSNGLPIIFYVVSNFAHLFWSGLCLLALGLNHKRFFQAARLRRST
jgi:hypothetical protein